VSQLKVCSLSTQPPVTNAKIVMRIIHRYEYLQNHSLVILSCLLRERWKVFTNFSCVCVCMYVRTYVRTHVCMYACVCTYLGLLCVRMRPQVHVILLVAFQSQ